MRRIAVVNQKGGVGKTTTTAHLGAAIAKRGKRVLLIDLDPQGHLSLHFGVEVADDQPSVYDVLTSSTPIKDVGVKLLDNLTLVPADIDLAGAEVELISVTGREVILVEAVNRVQEDYDVMLIDCPPSLGVLTINALVAAHEVVIPLQAQFFALQGMTKLLNTVTLVRKRINQKLTVSGIVLCMHESTTRLGGEVVDDLTAFLGNAHGTDVAWSEARVFRSHIRRNIKLAEASSFGQTVFDYAPKCNGAFDYERLTAELLGEPEPPIAWQPPPSRIEQESSPAEMTNVHQPASGPTAQPAPTAPPPTPMGESEAAHGVTTPPTPEPTINQKDDRPKVAVTTIYPR